MDIFSLTKRVAFGKRGKDAISEKSVNVSIVESVYDIENPASSDRVERNDKKKVEKVGDFRAVYFSTYTSTVDRKEIAYKYIRIDKNVSLGDSLAAEHCQAEIL